MTAVSQSAVCCLARAGIIGTFVVKTASPSAVQCLAKAGIVGQIVVVTAGCMSQWVLLVLFFPQAWLEAGWGDLFRGWWREVHDRSWVLRCSLSHAQK